MKHAIVILLLALPLSSNAAVNQNQRKPEIFLKCAGERSSTTIKNDESKSEDLGESFSELKIDGKSIYVMGYDGEYINLALPVGHRSLKYKVTKHSYSVGSRFVKLDTTYVLDLTLSTEAKPSLQQSRVEYLIDRHKGTYSFIETTDNRGRVTWFMRTLDFGVCEPFNPNKQKF